MNRIPIGEALTKQANSLILIHLSWPIQFCCSIFTKFFNLKILIIDGFIPQNHLQKANLPNLQYLELHSTDLYEATIIIQSTKGSLQDIRFKHSCITAKHNLKFIQSITQYCPNLKSATLFYDYNYIKELETLFSTCSQLERLVIISMNYNYSYNILLDLLAMYAPSSLCSLKLEYFNDCNPAGVMKTFFKRWKEKHQSTISVYILNSSVYIINNNIEMVEVKLKGDKSDYFNNFRYFDWD